MALPLVWLADVLRAAGLRVVETSGWKTRYATGGSHPTNPAGVLEHHTATTTSYSNPAPTVNLCINGRSDLAGPLCHAVIGYDGTMHVIAAGRANHAGRAKASGPNPAGDGNTLYVGFEWDYQGVNQAPSPQQYDAAVRATAAVLRRIGRPAEAARGHKETSVTGKIDPGRVDMNSFRADVARALAGGGAADEPGGIESMALNTPWTDSYGNRQDVEGFMKETQRDLNDTLDAVRNLSELVRKYTADQAYGYTIPASPDRFRTFAAAIAPKNGRVVGNEGDTFVSLVAGEDCEIKEVAAVEDWSPDGKPGKKTVIQGPYTLKAQDRQSFAVPGAATQISVTYKSDTHLSLGVESDAKWK